MGSVDANTKIKEKWFMNWDLIESANMLYKDDSLWKERNLSILEFQLRILDIVHLKKTPLIEKINFLSIIDTNLRDFVSTRLLSNSLSERSNLVHVIENIYRKMADCLIYYGETYGFTCPSYKEYCTLEVEPPEVTYSGESPNELREEMLQKVDIANMIVIMQSQGFVISAVQQKQIEAIIEIPDIIWGIPQLIEMTKTWIDPKLRYPKLVENFHEILNEDYYAYLQQNDVLVRCPYDSYETVVRFVCEMASHPKIRTIMITLYRTAHENSKILHALKMAKMNGKDVFVFVETTARGDEDHNLRTMEELRSVGIMVSNGYLNYKVHAKLCVAIDKTGLIFTHIGTGNYNENTSKLYTDFHYLTTNPSIGEASVDILHSIFTKKDVKIQTLNGPLSVSPVNFRMQITDLIEQEKLKGEYGLIRIKCNSICDCGIIKKLYDAADNGVDVRIICRTACSMRYHKNIIIKSKVGRFLEHDRFYIFGHRCFISSADLLLRNINKRIELLCEITNPNLRWKIASEFGKLWNDQWIHQMDSSGRWHICDGDS